MERRRARGRRRAGFTLAEVLVTLGIVAVLLALAVPSVAVVRKNLKMAELNATAREIFVAAQNNLTGLAAGGGKVELSAKAAEEDPDKMVCVMSGEAVMDSVLPLGAVDPTAAGNHYMVVYYPATLTVAEVYYSERAFDKGGEPLRGEYGGADKADARRKDEVGFYNGENATASPAKSLPKPILTVTNGEELVVEVSMPELEDELIGNVVLTVTVSSMSHPENSCEIYKGAPNGVTQVEQVLDSLTGVHFKNRCPEIAPGDDIKITASIAYTGKDSGAWITSEVSQKNVSSLFERREGNTVYIKYGRHLQNLNMNTSGVGNSIDDPITAAVQTAQILWDSKRNFTPIYNFELLSYDGNGLGIYDLYIKVDSAATQKRVGLFSDFESLYTGVQAQLKNICLVDPKIDSLKSKDIDTGALAGHIYNTVVTNCQVYATDAKSGYVKGSGSTGGLFGATVDSQLSYCSTGLPVVDCFNNSEVKLGGLIGIAEKTSLNSCYAASDQLSGVAKYIGGFIGRGDSVEISNCYAVGNISANKLDGGFISGFMNGNGNVESSYAAMTYFDESGEAREWEINYGFMSTMKHPTCAYLKPNSPVTILNSEDEKTKELTYEELKSWGAGKSAWTTLSELDSHPYRKLDDDEPKAYPFPGLQTAEGSPLPHYGSWPKEPENKLAAGTALVYLEEYDGGGVGMYGFDLEGTALTQLPLSGDIKTIQTAQYGVLVPGELSEPGLEDIVINGEITYPVSFSATGKKSVYLEDAQYSFFPFSGADLNDFETMMTPYLKDGAASGLQLKLAETEYYVHPWFGASIVMNAERENLGKQSGTPYQIRTQRQLARMCRAPNISNAFFIQTHSIYVDETWTTASLSLSGGQTFDGGGQGGHVIYTLPAPLFGTLGTGTAQNVTISSATIKGAKDTGIFAESSQATVTNCHVLDSHIEGDGNIAGFIRASSGSIQGSSFHATEHIDGAIVKSTQYATGFVDSNSVPIEDCFVTGQVKGGNTAAGFVRSNSGNIARCYVNAEVMGTSQAGGFAYESSAPLTDCYVQGKVTASSLGYAGGFATSAAAVSFSRCYTAATVSGWFAYGFGPYSSVPHTQCYYLAQDALTPGAGEDKALLELVGLSMGDAWSKATVEQSHPYHKDLAGQAYPYPHLNTLDHWGDWPQEPAGFPVEENILGVFYYTVTALDNGKYRFSVHTSALKCDSDGKEMPEGKNPFAEVMTVEVALDAPPTNKFGMGVFWSDGFNFDVAHGKDKGYYYEGGENKVRLDSDSIQQSAVFYPGYHFVTVEPDEDDGEYEIELKFKHNGSSGTNGHDWDCEFQYSNEKGFELDLDQD